MATRAHVGNSTRRDRIPYINEEVTQIIRKIENETGNQLLAQSLEFNPTALTHIKRLLIYGGSIIADTNLIVSDIEQAIPSESGVQVKCFLDEPEVVKLANLHRSTRAEIAADVGLSTPGLKLMVVSAAPATLNRIITRRKHEPMTDVCVLAAPTGFASVVQLKEKLRESDMAYIVARGKQGGIAATVTILNSILKDIQEK